MESRQPPSSSVRKTILVVDADPQSLRIVDVSLRRAGFDVRAATDGTVAASVLDRVPPPDLIIADADLPGIDGFELCRRTKSSTRTGAIPFIFLARPHAAHKMRAFELGADDFLSKPVFVTEVVARVSALLQRHERERLASRDVDVDHASGSLADLSTIDLLQTIATNGKSGVLHLRSASGVQGEIYFRRGAVVDAEVGRLSGSDAVYRLLSWTDGRFEIEWRNIRRRDAVALPAPALLMEGMRRLDEWTRITQQLPPLDTVFEVDYRLLAERLADIPDEVNGILRLFDGLRTAMQVIDDCGLSDLDALTVIGKLNSEGLIRNMPATSVEDDKTGPDLEGWLGQPLEGASPLLSAPTPVEPESRLRRVSDPHDASLRPEPGAAEPRAAEPRKNPTAPVPEWRDRTSDDHPTSGREASGVPVLRPDEPAVVIPFPTSTPAPNRQTLVSATGGPMAAVAGEISNGVATPSVSGAAMPTAPSSHSASASPPMTAAAEPTISTPRSTDPGLGPLPPVPAPAPRVAAAPAQPAAPSAPPLASSSVAAAPPASLEEHPVAVAVPLTSRRDSASRVAELPFSDSASRWMTEGDEIHNHKSRAEALDEMGLQSRFRGWALLVGVVVFAGGSVFAVRILSGAHKTEPAAPVTTAPPAPEPAPPPASNPPPAAPPTSGLAENSPGPSGEKVVVAEANPASAAGAVPAAPPPNPGAPAAVAAAVAAGEPAAASPEASQLLATCQSAFNAGRMKDATTACTAAVEASPDSAKAIALLAHAEFNRSHRKEALSWAEKAIKIDPKLADAYVIIGGVQQDAGRNADAKSAYRKYLELAPKGQYATDLRAIVDTL